MCRDALYREAMDLYRAGEGGFPRAALALPDAIEAVCKLLRDAAKALAHPEHPGCMVAMAPVDDFGRELRRESVRLVAERLARGVADGQVRLDVDPVQWAELVMAVIQGLSSQARDGRSAATLAATAEAAVTALAVLRAKAVSRRAD